MEFDKFELKKDKNLKMFISSKIKLINKSSECEKRKIIQLIIKYYYAANPRIIFTSKPLLTQGGKDPI